MAAAGDSACLCFAVACDAVVTAGVDERCRCQWFAAAYADAVTAGVEASPSYVAELGKGR